MSFNFKRYRTKTKKRRPPSPYKRAKDLLDRVFSVYIRLRDGRRYHGVCPICNSRPIGVCFHFFPRAILATRFETDASCGSCAPCNQGERLNRGRTDKYKNALIGMVGQARYDELEKLSHDKVKLSVDDLLAIKRDFDKKLLEAP